MTEWADSGHRGAQSRAKRGVQWQIAGRPSDMAKLPEGRAKARAREQEHRKASIRAKVWKTRIMQTNELRGLMYEFGIVLPEGHAALLNTLPDAMCDMLMESLDEQLGRVQQLQADIGLI